MSRIAIVGSGISAMYAVLACYEKGFYPDVYMRDIAYPKGAIFLRYLPKSLRTRFPKYDIIFDSVGTRKCYIMKQWYNIPKGYRSSFPRTRFVNIGYEPNSILYYVFSSKFMMNKISINSNFDDNALFSLGSTYDLVFHSFPNSKLKSSLQRYIVKLPILTKSIEDVTTQEIIYNGSPESLIVRKSVLFGKEYLELSQRTGYSDTELRTLFPKYDLSFSQDLDPGTLSMEIPDSTRNLSKKIIAIGRLGRMERSELADNTFSLVTRILDENLK